MDVPFSGSGGPPAQVGCYRILERLGEGGMGIVFLAYDSELARRVAIKWLKQATTATMERLKQEAQLHARVEHPAVCRLYQVAEHNGWPYLVMQYVHGQTLDRIAPELDLETKLRLMASLADGVHAAHRQGLIHRDLKPTNLMVERDEAGGWRPYVMDFGLARDASSGTLTEAGSVLGSPAYMAPEQITGSWVDPRADIYALGASLFEVLTGRPPFQGKTTLETLAQVQSQEAPKLREFCPGMPRDLETVLQICLAKDPARRYPSAAALRDDLLRVLDGEPVQARRPSFLEVGLRWVKKNRLASAFAAAVVASLLITGVVWIRARQRAQAQSYWAQRFGQEAIRMESILRFGRMLPPHDLLQEMEQVRQRMLSVQSQMTQNEDSQGPGHFTLGEGYLLLNQPGKARGELESAWKSGYRPPEVSLALGRCFIDLYLEAYPDSVQILDKQLREERQGQLRKDFLDPALVHLKRAKLELGGLPRVEEVRFAIAENRFDDASSLAQATYQAEPWRYEALYHLAVALGDRALEEQNAGKIAETKRCMENALANLEIPQRVGPSDERVFIKVAHLLFNGRALKPRNLSPQASMQQALMAIDQTHSLNRFDTRPLALKALIECTLGNLAAEKGETANVWYDRAEAVCLQGLEAPPSGQEFFYNRNYVSRTRIECYGLLISILGLRASLSQSHTEDIRPLVEKGIHYYELAQQEDRVEKSAHIGAASLYLALSEQQQARGKDGQESLDLAIESFRKCTRLDLDSHDYLNFVTALVRQAEMKSSAGKDPEPCLEEAQKAADDGLRLAPASMDLHCAAGKVALEFARWAGKHQQDPLPMLEKARIAYESALGTSQGPSSAVSGMTYLASLAQLHAMAAEVQLERQKDPASAAHKAIDYGKRAMNISTDIPGKGNLRALAHDAMDRAQKVLNRAQEGKRAKAAAS
jgi:eukaryotic-like serine/threonine-protein kinase